MQMKFLCYSTKSNAIKQWVLVENIVTVIGSYETFHRQSHALAEQTGRYIAEIMMNADGSVENLGEKYGSKTRTS